MLHIKGNQVRILNDPVTVFREQTLKSIVLTVEGDSNPKTFLPKLLGYYHKGKFPVDKLMEFYDFEDINKAFEESHQGIAIKSVMRMM